MLLLPHDITCKSFGSIFIADFLLFSVLIKSFWLNCSDRKCLYYARWLTAPFFPPLRRSMVRPWCCCAVTSSWSTWDWSWGRRSSCAITSRGWSRPNSKSWRHPFGFLTGNQTHKHVLYCTRTKCSVSPPEPEALRGWVLFCFFSSRYLSNLQGTYKKCAHTSFSYLLFKSDYNWSEK